jgi:hypothetical protein
MKSPTFDIEQRLSAMKLSDFDYEMSEMSPLELPPSAMSSYNSEDISSDGAYLNDRDKSNFRDLGGLGENSYDMLDQECNYLCFSSPSSAIQDKVSEEKIDNFRLPSAVISDWDEVLRPSVSFFRPQEMLQNKQLNNRENDNEKKIHPDSILNFLQSELANGVHLKGCDIWGSKMHANACILKA